MINHQNHGYSAGIPLEAGDRYYAQDLGRDFYFLQDMIGAAMLSGFGLTPGNAALFDFSLPTVDGISPNTVIDLPLGMAVLPFSITIPNSYSAIPPSTSSATVNMPIYWSAFTIDVSTLGCTGTATYSLYASYSEVIKKTRQRAKATGTYGYEVLPTLSLGVTTGSIPAGSVLLCTFTYNSGSSPITNITFPGVNLSPVSFPANQPSPSSTLIKNKINRIKPATRTVTLPIGSADGEFIELDASEAGVTIIQGTSNDLVRFPGAGGSTIGTSGQTNIPAGFYGLLKYIASWFGIVSPVKITNPANLPPNNGRGASWSKDGKYLAIAHTSSPFVTIYDWTTGSPVKISDPATLPASDATGAAWSHDSKYLAISHTSSPFITIYDFSSGSPVKISNPGTLPAGNGRGVSWSPENRYLAVAHDTTPFITIYDWITGSPVKISDPATLPAGNGLGIGWSPDGRFLAIGHQSSPSVTIYDWITGVPVKITNPGTLPNGDGTGISWSPDGRYLTVSNVTSPFYRVYDFISGSPALVSNAATIPAGNGQGVGWSPDGRYLAFAHVSSPYVSIYDWITGSPVKISNPATLPASDGICITWSPDGRYLVVGHSSSPFVTIYDWATSVTNGWKLIPLRMPNNGSGLIPTSKSNGGIGFMTYLFFSRTFFK